MRRALILHGAAALLACGAAGAAAQAAPTPPQPATLFSNVRVFDGKAGTLSAPGNVLVVGNVIKRISASAIAAEPNTALTTIDSGGRTLMPGLIDAHWHTMFATLNLAALMTAHIGYVNIVADRSAEDTLQRGFTSVRDLSGPVWGVKRAVDQGLVAGRRIWPSGAMISQTSGHADYRAPHDLPRLQSSPPSYTETIGASAIADGPDEVRRAVREQLMLGASHIKLAAGGGVASDFDPLDVWRYSEAEFRATVEAAENWGTYVTVHAYTPRAIQGAIRGGVKCIDHDQLMDEATAKLMADNGIWLSMQPFLDDEDAIPFAPASPKRAKQLQMTQGTDNAYALAQKYKLKTA